MRKVYLNVTVKLIVNVDKVQNNRGREAAFGIDQIKISAWHLSKSPQFQQDIRLRLPPKASAFLISKYCVYYSRKRATKIFKPQPSRCPVYLDDLRRVLGSHKVRERTYTLQINNQHFLIWNLPHLLQVNCAVGFSCQLRPRFFHEQFGKLASSAEKTYPKRRPIKKRLDSSKLFPSPRPKLQHSSQFCQAPRPKMLLEVFS